MSRKTIILAVTLVFISVSLNGQEAFSKQRVLTPSAVVRIANPTGVGDVRLLVKFDMPDGIQPGNLIVATLRVGTSGVSEVPFSIGLLNASWSPNDGWASLRTNLQESPGFEGEGEGCMLMTNHLEPGEGGEVDRGIELIITPWVRQWISDTNYGVGIRRMGSREDNLSARLPAETVPAIELVLLYLD